MSDIGQIVRDTVWVSLPEFIRLVFAGTAGGLIGAYINDRLTRKREGESAIMAEKKQFVPLIDGFIEITGNCEGHYGEVRNKAQEQLFEPARRFRLHLKGKRLRIFDEVWERFYRTTRDEVHIAQPDETKTKKEEMEKILISRLKQLLDVVERS